MSARVCQWSKGCAYTDPVSTFTVQGPEKTWRVDLCEAHAEPLVELASMGGVVGTPRGRSQADVMEGLWEE